jgi:hypothetical protein
MIAFAKSSPAAPETSWQEGFLQLLPRIRHQLRLAFADYRGEARQDAIQEAIALACVAYVRLYESGKQHLAFAAPLARYAVARVRAGRTVGTRLNSGDVLSPYAQRLRALSIYHPDGRDDEYAWHHLLTENRRCTPAELAASRIDFDAWLKQLPGLKRRVAQTLAGGETGQATARQHRVTPGRISQLRRELQRNWSRFQGETAAKPVTN